MARTSKTDIRDLERYFKQLSHLSKKEVQYGFYDQKHYSGLNMATLAAIHEQGWNNLPERNFMYSTAILFKTGLAKHIKRMHNAIIQKKPFGPSLEKIGRDGAESLRFTIDQGTFTNPRVSKEWAGVKGFDAAMVHYGDLSSAATFKVTSAKGGKKNK